MKAFAAPLMIGLSIIFFSAWSWCSTPNLDFKELGKFFTKRVQSGLLETSFYFNDHHISLVDETNLMNFLMHGELASMKLEYRDTKTSPVHGASGEVIRFFLHGSTSSRAAIKITIQFTVDWVVTTA